MLTARFALNALCALMLFFSVAPKARAALIPQDIVDKIESQGVPAKGLENLVQFYEQNDGRDFVEDVYTCKDQKPEDVTPCEKDDRKSAHRTLRLGAHTYAVLIDFSQSSLEERYYLINWKTGAVTKSRVAHGVNSGNLYAYKFSNTQDSLQTSLGIYMTGDLYQGKYKTTLRLYGLEASNDQAFKRDIVMHGAWYSDPDFPAIENGKTGKPFARLGLSNGCPALPVKFGEKVIPLLKGGALVYHYHPTLNGPALSGRAVEGPNPETATKNASL